MSEKNIAVAAVIILIILVAGLTWLVNFEKTQPGYTGEQTITFLVGIEKYFLVINAVIALALFGISSIAYGKLKTTRFAFLSMAFLVLSLNVLLKIADRYFISGNLVIAPVDNLLEMFFLALLALGIFRKN